MKLFVVYVFLFCTQAWGFPQLSRHGYFNCNACHYSPSGGGLLNPYGRELSAELLSTFSREGESKPFYGIIPDSDHFTVAGYVRAVQVLTDNISVREAKAILMQSDLELGVLLGPFTAVGSIGRRQITFDGLVAHQAFSRTHYLLYSTPFGLNLRAGRFMPAWGLNHPDHSLWVRRDLAFGNDSERYTAELSFLAESFSVIGSVINGSMNDRYSRSNENARSILVQHVIGESSRVGLDFYKGDSPLWTRKIFGGFSLLSWSKAVFSQIEANYQWKRTTKSEAGYVASHLLNWEIKKGIIPYFSQQYESLDRDHYELRSSSYGVGVNWYPRPHLEIQGQVGRKFHSKGLDTTVLLLMANIYL